MIAVWPLETAWSGVISVPADYPTIGIAVEAAVYGDTVLVAWGRYEESGIALKSGVVVQSMRIRPSRTSICGDGTSPLVLCDGVDSSAALIGFCLCGGAGVMGGAVVNQNSSPSIHQCEFIGNTANGRGGAVHNQSSSPEFRDCIFRENVAGLGGGAVSISGGSRPYFEDCVFFTNLSGGVGGAVVAEDRSSAMFVDCAFLGNYVDSGGSVHVRDDSHIQMTHCTLVGNRMYSRGPSAGLQVVLRSSADVSRCLFAHNDGQAVHCHNCGLVSLSCCNLWGCSKDVCWKAGIEGQQDKRGNFSKDPLLADPEVGDIHMSVGSPCYADENACDVFIGCRSFRFSDVVSEEPDLRRVVEKIKELLHPSN